MPILDLAIMEGVEKRAGSVRGRFTSNVASVANRAFSELKVRAHFAPAKRANCSGHLKY